MTKPRYRNKRPADGASGSDLKKVRAEREAQWRSQPRGEENKLAFVLNNRRFETFYQAVDWMLPDQDPVQQWEAFLAALRAPLPACFHMDPSYAFTDTLKKQLHDILDRIRAAHTAEDGSSVIPIELLQWYPEGCGYKFGIDRRAIRKDEKLTELHQWLVKHTENGNVTRQEAVSMIPPLALNVEPHHKCLDVCAAPGSKTSQLLEIVNRSLSQPEEQQGLVVANDADTSRAYMLVHQCRRINSPLLAITTHKGQMYPAIRDYESESSNKYSKGFFDRVLCDVPCSGDGTMRKNPVIWSKWSTQSSHGLHSLQLNIACRNLLLVKPGGLMVYSTCSMSPYEDEAVVAELLRRFKGSIELVDAKEFVPLFKSRRGLNSWYVLDDTNAIKRENSEKRLARRQQQQQEAAENATGETTETTEAMETVPESEGAPETAKPAEQSVIAVTEAAVVHPPKLQACLDLGMEYYQTFEEVPLNLHGRIKRSAFPPTAEEASWMHLERCMRCLPHDEDTGGFFVATFRVTDHTAVKEAAENAASEAVEEPVVQEALLAVTEAAEIDCNDCGDAVETAVEPTEQSAGPNKSAVGAKGMVEYTKLNREVFNTIKDFYGFTDGLSPESLYIREEYKQEGDKLVGGGKSIYLLPAPVRRFLNSDREGKLKIVSAGIKVIERKTNSHNDNSVEYRLVQEGVHLLVPHITDRLVPLTIQEFCNLLESGLVSLHTFEAATVAHIDKQPPGVMICVYKYNAADVVSAEGIVTSDKPIEHTFYALCWKGKSFSRTINVICNKVEIEGMKHQMQALGIYRPKISSTRTAQVQQEATEQPSFAESSSTVEASN